MNLAILHYHLTQGGVTRVIENQLLALDEVLDPAEQWRVALLYGGRHQGWNQELAGRLRTVRLSLEEVPLLDYDEYWQAEHPHESEQLLGQITSVFDRLGFAPGETLLHVHNHSLGKNRLLPPAISQLAQSGYAALLQIHDFAEDFRPENYRAIHQEHTAGAAGDGVAAIYPQSPAIHYAALNGRDHDILSESGVAAEQLHRLPNPVPGIDHLPEAADARRLLEERFGVSPSDRFFLYPVRCIRRKNIGEALLYSALLPAGSVVGLTLAPWNPVEKPVYESWKELAASLELPCRFDVGGTGGLSFAQNMAAADVILTTSLAEGFGMVFFESWLAGRPLVGRDLPEITRDFTRLGLRLDQLAPSLRIPLDWVGLKRFQRTVIEGYRRALATYGREEPDRWLEDLEAKTADGCVDFGDLDEPMQRTVIEAVHRSEANRRRVLECNPRLEDVLDVDSRLASDVIGENVRVIDRNYSLSPSGGRLLGLYERIAASRRGEEPRPLLHPERILDRFLDLKRFRLLRS